jgi:hypothetical protein
LNNLERGRGWISSDGDALFFPEEFRLTGIKEFQFFALLILDDVC